MKLGLFNSPLHPRGRLHADTYEEVPELTTLADELGHSEARIGEHFTTEWENMSMLYLFIARAFGWHQDDTGHSGLCSETGIHAGQFLNRRQPRRLRTSNSLALPRCQWFRHVVDTVP